MPTDDDLPGLWEHADFEGGDPDDRGYLERELERKAGFPVKRWVLVGDDALAHARAQSWRKPPRRYPGHDILDCVRAANTMLRRTADGNIVGGVLRHIHSDAYMAEVFYIDTREH